MTEPRRILLVEDQKIVAADLENTLTALGYRVVGAAVSGEEAIEKAMALRPELVLMDIRLQGAMDGIEAARVIRARLDVPIVYLTAYADEETIARAGETTPFGYVVKPFNDRELRGNIEIALYKHETDRRVRALEREEERLRSVAEEERRFRILFDGVKDYAIVLLDPEGRVTRWNTGAERITGYPTGEILGRHMSIFYPVEELARGRPNHNLRRAVADGRAEDEGFRVRRDGSRFWAEVVITPLRDEVGALYGFSAVTRDLTEWKRRDDRQRLLDQATMALVASLEVHQTLERAARLVLAELGDGCVVDVADDNGQLAQLAVAHLDPAMEELARSRASQLPPPPADGPGPARVFHTGASEVFPQPDGHAPAAVDARPELWRELGVASALCVPILLRQRSLGVVSLLASAPRTYSSDEIAFAEEFARRAALAIDNARLYREAQEAVRARDEFLAIASHELRTPLTPLQLQLDMLGRSLAKTGVPSAKIAERLERASRQTVRLTRLVESLLDVSRITSGRLTLAAEEFDFCEMINEVAERFRAEARTTESTLEVEAPPPLVGRWDRTRIEQVVSNLLANAIKYGAGRPVRIDVSGEDATVRLTVTDHGIGIERDALARIFDRFERAVSVRHYGGLGLGLYIARQIVEAHRGSILAHSQPGSGTTFTVVLPRFADLRREGDPTQPGDRE